MAKATDEAEETAALVSQNNQNSEATDDPVHPKLPIWRKVAYGSGSILYSTTTVVLGFFLQIFLLEVAILDPVYVAVIVFAGRVWDAITDPIIGYLSSHTRTRIGRLRPWLLLSVLPIGVCYFCLWIVPHWPTGARFAYYLLVYFVLQALATCYHVPYTALIMHLTNCNKQRDSATLYRMCFEVAGTLIGSLIQGIAIALSGHNSNTACIQGGTRTYDEALEGAYRYSALTVAVVAILAGLVPFFGVKEQREQQNVKKGLPFFKGLKVTLLYKPYAYLTALYMLCWLAIQFVQANLALYVKYVTGLGDHFQYIIIVVLLCSVLSMPLWQYLIVKFGKKTAFYCGIWVFMLTLFTLLFLDKWDFVVYLVYPIAAVAGVGVGAIYLLPWSMLPDVVDQANLDHGVRREELFYSFYVFYTKFGAGVSLGISTLVLKLGEYNEEVCLQLWSVSLTLKLMLSVAPVLLVMLSLIFLRLYPITESVRRTNRLLLARRYQNAPPNQIVHSTGNHGNKQPSLPMADTDGSADPTASPSLTPPSLRGSSSLDKALRSGDISDSCETTNI